MEVQKFHEECFFANYVDDYPYPIRKRVWEEYQKGNVLNPIEIQFLYCDWEIENSILQNRSIRNPYDLLYYQDDLNQILETHQGYLNLPLNERKEMIESMFLHRFYSYLKPQNRFSLVRESIRLNLSQHKLDHIPILLTDSMDENHVMAHIYFQLDGEQIFVIAVNRSALQNITYSGVQHLERLHHELDHHYLFKYKTSRELKECYFAMTHVDQRELSKYGGFYYNFIYHFMPSEYRAFKSSYEIVTSFLRNNPYADEQDMQMISEFQYPRLQDVLNQFNQYFSTNYTLEGARNLVFYYLLSFLEEEVPNQFLEHLHSLGLDENDYHPRDRNLAKKYFKQLR